MQSLASLYDNEGRSILCREDGTLVAAGAATPDSTHVLLAHCAGDGPVLLGARVAELRCGALAQPILPFWRENRGEGLFVLRTHKTGPALCVSGGVLEPGTADGDAARFRLGAAKREREDTSGSAAVLWDIPEGMTFDASGMKALLEGGGERMLPVVDALLSFFPAAEAREIWSQSPRHPPSDVFHALIRAHGRAVLPVFSAYTADAFRWHCQNYGWTIGEKTYGVPNVMEAGRGRLSIGRYCSLANPCIILANHNTRSVTSYPFVDLWTEWPGTTVGMTDHHAKDVIIGNDVWIGTQAVILPGSVIGDGAIIGAGAMVRGKIPPYAKCTGNPATITGRRFDDATIDRLLRLRWWDWPDGKVDRYIEFLLGTDIGAFLDKAEAEDELARSQA